MSYLGNTPTTQSFISGTDYFNGTGAQTAFTLSRTVNSVNDVEVFVNNVAQKPNDAYTISGTTLTFTGAPSAGTQNIYVRYLSTTTQTITPSQNTVSYASWNSDLQTETWAFRNRIINGAMMIDQRNAGASVTPTTDGVCHLDRWRLDFSQASKMSIQQNAGSVTPPVGFTNYLGITSLAATSVGASDYFSLEQRIEGFNTADLGFGTANASPVTLSFWVRSSLTGTFGGSLRNAAVNRSYPYTYTINSANTWEYKTITIAGDTTGTWNTTNGAGITVFWGLGVGSNFSGTAGAWAGVNNQSATGATSVVGTNGATFYITGVQLEKGSTATSFDYRPYGTELALCQRYFYRISGAAEEAYAGSGWSDSTTSCITIATFPVTMRAKPTFSTSGTASDYNIRQAAAVVQACTAVPNASDSTTNIARINAAATGLTTGYGAAVRNATTNGFFAFSAEL